MISRFHKPRCGECGAPTVGSIRADLVPQFTCERPGCDGAWAGAREDHEAQLAAFVDEICEGGRYHSAGYWPWAPALCAACGGFFLQTDDLRGPYHVCGDRGTFKVCSIKCLHDLNREHMHAP